MILKIRDSLSPVTPERYRPAMPDPGPRSGTTPGDTRGIVDPSRMLEIVDFRRHPPGPTLHGVVDWLWSVRWDLPPGVVHEQQVLNHPAANISIGTTDDAGATVDQPRGRVYGATRRLSVRRLEGPGWTVAAKTTAGGLGAFIGYAARQLTDATAPLSVVGLTDELVAEVAAARTEAARIDLLRTALERSLLAADPARVTAARQVAAIAHLAEHDRSIQRVEQLAGAAGVGVRTLQRLFVDHVGVTPLEAVRRWRLLDAAEAAAAGEPVDWAGLAAELGYSDQPHLVRDVSRHLGVPPSAYLARQRR